MWGELHEEKIITISLPDTVQAGTGNRLFRELGATLHYDVYSFSADKNEDWQSESLLHVELRAKGETVDAQDDFDEIKLVYPFANRPSSDQTKALDLSEKVASKFNGKVTYQGKAFDKAEVTKDWDSCNDFLLKEWGEETGSESLRRMIEENYT